MNKTFKVAAFTLALLSIGATAAFAQAAEEEVPAVENVEVQAAPAPAPVITVSGKVKVKGKGDARVITMRCANKKDYVLKVGKAPEDVEKPVTLDDLAKYKGKNLTVQGIVDSENYTIEVVAIGFKQNNQAAPAEK